MRKTKADLEKEILVLKNETSKKDIDRFEEQLRKANIDFERGGWTENITKDHCEWLDIKLPSKSKKYRLALSLYFKYNSTMLESIRVFKEKRIITYESKELTLNGTEKRKNPERSSD